MDGLFHGNFEIPIVLDGLEVPPWIGHPQSYGQNGSNYVDPEAAVRAWLPRPNNPLDHAGSIVFPNTRMKNPTTT